MLMPNLCSKVRALHKFPDELGKGASLLVKEFFERDKRFRSHWCADDGGVGHAKLVIHVLGIMAYAYTNYASRMIAFNYAS